MKLSKNFFAVILFAASFFGVKAQAVNSSYVTEFGEKALQFSIIVPGDRAEVWKLFTTLKVNLNDHFPPEAQNEDQNLQEIIQFVEIEKGKTKIISTMVGWGQGSHWDKTYTFFEKGNEWTYNELLKLFDDPKK